MVCRILGLNSSRHSYCKKVYNFDSSEIKVMQKNSAFIRLTFSCIGSKITTLCPWCENKYNYCTTDEKINIRYLIYISVISVKCYRHSCAILQWCPLLVYLLESTRTESCSLQVIITVGHRNPMEDGMEYEWSRSQMIAHSRTSLFQL